MAPDLDLGEAATTLTLGAWAIATGASAGIGAEFCRQLAAGGLNVVVIARRRERLEQLAAALRSRHDVQALVLTLELTAM